MANNQMAQLHRKLENDECFDYGCMSESMWKIIYMTEHGRTETRLCEMHSDEFLATLSRPRTLVRIKRD